MHILYMSIFYKVHIHIRIQGDIQVVSEAQCHTKPM